jgi:hypothetical protein
LNIRLEAELNEIKMEEKIEKKVRVSRRERVVVWEVLGMGWQKRRKRRVVKETVREKNVDLDLDSERTTSFLLSPGIRHQINNNKKKKFKNTLVIKNFFIFKIYQNNIFLFFKIYFKHQHIKII